jgi:type II secretory pathway pseudopilin PulG
MNALLRRRRSQHGFTMVETLVVAAILITIGAIVTPIVQQMRMRSHKVQTLKVMANLGAALGYYAADHDGMLPEEDVSGKDDWAASALPSANRAWYNALPRTMRSQAVSDFVAAHREAAFYSKESVLFLPGALYPEARKMSRPYFAIAINSKLQRRESDGSKPPLRLSQAPHASRTVAFFERGMPGEKYAHRTMSKSDYDGSPKGTAKGFVARYSGEGVVTFLDGSARSMRTNELLQENGDIIWSSDQAASDPSMILWAPDPQVDPNARPGQE